jgi:ferrous-iron efflux pump FieF
MKGKSAKNLPAYGVGLFFMKTDILNKDQILQRAMRITLGLSFFLVVVKSIVYATSGSAAVLATLIDSVIDFLVSGLLLYALWYAARPADHEHRYGHGKMEGVASLFQAAMLSSGGIFLFYESLKRFMAGDALTAGLPAAVAIAATMIVSLLILKIQRNALSNGRSVIVEADSAHYRTDILLNGGVVVTLLIKYFGGPVWVDPVFGFLVAGCFLFYAAQIARESLKLLMDRELPDDVRARILDIAQGEEGVHGVHDLRTRDCGKHYHIAFDVELDKHLTLKAAHDIVRQVDEKIMAAYPNAEVLIHMDPKGDTYDSRHHDHLEHHY